MEMFIDQKRDKKQTYTGVLVVLILLFLLGLILVLVSAAVGISTANVEMAKNGGSMDTAMYQYIMSNTAESYRIVGAIISVITGVGALLAGMVGYRQRKQ
jgi:TctA family transporter